MAGRRGAVLSIESTSVQDYVKDLPGEHSGGFQDGGHDSNYWRSILPDVLSFLGRNLA